MSGGRPPPVAAVAVAGEDPPPSPWQTLRALTPARVALGRSGASLPTAPMLRFDEAHALARDAVQVPLDVPELEARLREGGWPVLLVHSRVPDRAGYLMRPDLGRRLDQASAARLAGAAPAFTAGGAAPDLVLVAADGLSPRAVQRQAASFAAALRPQLPPAWVLGPVVVAQQARVALGDEVGALLGARRVAVLIGERPGLSAPESMGIYLTWEPRIGRRDAERDCISNVRPDGLPVAEAAAQLAALLAAAERRRATGVGLGGRPAIGSALAQAEAAGPWIPPPGAAP